MIEKKQPYAALRNAILAAFVLSSGLAHSDPTEDHRDAHHQYMEEVVVTAPFKTTAAETMQPINVLTGEALLEEIADTLGETLKGEIGINSASFGSGVGHPIIRGHTGNRIGVLQNGVGTTMSQTKALTTQKVSRSALPIELKSLEAQPAYFTAAEPSAA